MYLHEHASEYWGVQTYGAQDLNISFTIVVWFENLETE